MWLLAIFIIVPLIEIALFIKVGGWLTLWPTLAIVLATGVLGTFLVRQQGLRVINELRGSMRDMRDPLSPLAHGALIVFAGALLLTPGFFTDAIGFALMVPPVRSFLIRTVASRIKVAQFSTRHPPHAQDNVIDADFIEISEPPKPNQRPSGWTKD